MHSHNYTPRQAYKRSFGEAWALAMMGSGRPEDFTPVRTVFLGWLNDARKDLRYCRHTRRLHEWPHALRIRWERRRGLLDGFKAGWSMHRQETTT